MDRLKKYQKEKIANLSKDNSAKRAQIDLLVHENQVLKEENKRLSDKIDAVYRDYLSSMEDCRNKISELNRMISGYNAAKYSLDMIKKEYENKVNELLNKLM